MSDDALYLFETFFRQRDAIKKILVDKKLRWDMFDKLSYRSWAIDETIEAINEYQSYVSVSVIRDILKCQISFYEQYYNANKERQIRYKYAMEAVESLFRLTEGYVYE